MSKRIHPTWNLASISMRRMLAAHYGVQARRVAVSTMETQVVTVAPDDQRLLIPRGLVIDPASPAPVGQIGEVQYQLQQPALFGAFASVFAPNIHSPWRETVEAGDAPDPDHYAAALELDQIRAEITEAGTRKFSRILMHNYLNFQLAHQPEPTTAQAMVKDLMLQFYARSTGGVITGGETGNLPGLIAETITPLLGEPLWEKITSILATAMNASGNNPAEMLSLGAQWDQAMGEVAENANERWMENLGLRRWYYLQLVAAATEKGISLLKLKYPPTATVRRPRAEPIGMQEWAHRLDDGDTTDQDTTPGGAPTEEENTNPSLGLPDHRYIQYRKPTGKEKNTAVAVSRQLQRLRYRKPGSAPTPSQMPHGRLNTRQLVQFTAQRNAGTTVTAKPWSKPNYAPSEQPGLSCALVLDTSRSMAAFRRNLTSLNWVLAQATHTVGGTLSSWGFGGDAFDIVRSGTTPRLVPDVIDTGADSNGSAQALAHAALDAQLENTSGTRIAIVVTDAALPETETAALNAVFGSLKNTGVETILVHVGNSRADHGITNAHILECAWSEDLAPMLTSTITEIYTSG